MLCCQHKSAVHQATNIVVMSNAASGQRVHAQEWLPLTWIPDTVKYGISNFTRMGGIRPFASSSASTLGRPNLHLNRNSFPPGKFLIFHTIASFSGAYTAAPCKAESRQAVSATYSHEYITFMMCPTSTWCTYRGYSC